MLGARAATSTDPRKAGPRPGDFLVFLKGKRKGEIIAPKDLPLGGPQVLAYPFDPESKIVKDGSRLNQVALIRLDPAQLAEKTRALAAEGVVAYSAVCTHQGCPVSMWQKDKAALFCSCHGSQFDPKDGARKLAGPAPRRLAALPLKLESGVLAAAGEFRGRVGFKKKR